MNYSILNILLFLIYDFLHRFESSYTKKILLEAIDLFNQLWPYIILGIFISTIIKIYISKQWLVYFFSKKTHFGILLASLLGVFSPLGSYVTIPIAAALAVNGVPIYVLMAFMVSSPIINPSLFTLTLGAFDIEMAMARLLSAFTIGICAGYLTKWGYKKGIITKKVLVNKNFIVRTNLEFNEQKMTFLLFLKEMYRFSVFISKYFFLAIILSAIIKMTVSPSFIIKIFSPDSLLSVIISTGAGVPFYVCGGAAIPVVQSLSELGLSQGAVLAYFISGPVTKISNLITLKAAFNTRLFLIYLATGILGAVLMGTVYNLI